MADQLFNIARGRDVQLAMNVNANTPANSALVVVLLTANEADDTLNNYDTLDALLGAVGNTEADATNYARKVLTDTDGIVVTVDDGSNNVNIDIPNQVYTALGGTTNNTFTKAVICYDDDTTAGDDTNIIPLYHFDIPVSDNTTNGQNYTLQISASGLITQ